MLDCLWVFVAMETHFHKLTLKYQYFEKFFEETLSKIKFATTFHNMFCKNIACLAIARERNYV